MSTRRRETAEAFVHAMVKRYGGTSKALRRNAAEVRFTQRPPFLDQRAATLAFERKALDHHPDARLAIPGSPLFVDLVDLAHKRGQAALVFTPIVEPLPADLVGGAIRSDLPIDVTQGETRNDPHVVLNFAISYQSVVTSDDLVSIGYDVARQSFRTPDIIDALHSLWGETLVECPGDWPRLEVPEARSLMPVALEEIRRLTQKKVTRARNNAKQFLEQEVKAIEDYYRQLIAEERELLSKVSAAGGKEAKDHEARIQRYQLDWKRRAAEEARHHQCRVHIRLVSWAIVYMPRTALTISHAAGKNGVEISGNGVGTGTDGPTCYFNHFVGTFDGLVCADTENERGPWHLAENGTWRSSPSSVDEGGADE